MKTINLNEFEIKLIQQSLENYKISIQKDEVNTISVNTIAPKDFMLSRIDMLIERITLSEKIK